MFQFIDRRITSKSRPRSRLDCEMFAGKGDATDILVCFSEEEGRLDREGWCERSCGGMRQRGYQFVEGSLCPISSVKVHVPRVLTLVTSLASSLPGDPGPGVFITNPPNSPLHHTAPSPKHSSPHGGKQNTSIPPPQPFLSPGTCTNWMHIHTLMHDDPSVDLCLEEKYS